MAGLQVHIFQRTFHRVDLAAFEVLGRRDNRSDWQHVFGRGAPSDDRRDVFALQCDDLVPMSVFVREERFPPVHRCFPLGTLRRMGAAFTVFERLFIRRDQAGARAAFDGHVADGHATFHRQVADRFTAIFDDVAGATGGAGLADDRQGDVLGRDAGAQLAGDLDLHVLALALDQRLGGKHVLNLRCADAMRQRAESAVGRGVAVATDDCHAGQGPALFGADDMHDALAHVRDGVVMHAELTRVLIQRRDLNAAVFGHRGGVFAALGGRHVVIRHGDGLVRCADGAARHAQPFKGLRTGHFVDEVTVDIQQASAVIGFVDDMGVPDFIVKRLGGHDGPLPWFGMAKGLAKRAGL